MKAATGKQHEEVIDDKSSVDQAVHVLVTPADPSDKEGSMQVQLTPTWKTLDQMQMAYLILALENGTVSPE